MQRLAPVLRAAVVGVVGGIVGVFPAEAQGPRVSALPGLQASLAVGSITGTVRDDKGSRLAGAMVSALGATLASTVTDERGQFTFSQLPEGEYLVRAHMSGFVASGGARVRVGLGPSVDLQLRRLETAIGTAGSTAPVKTRPIMVAGFDLPQGTEPEPADGATEATDHPHSELAWRLRHITRSILKDEGRTVELTDEDVNLPSDDSLGGSLFGRAVGSAASLATSLFTDLPFTGEVNLLTTSALGPGALPTSLAWPRGVAYLALAAPGAGGDWSIRAAMSEGDLASWVVAGAFASRAGRRHTYDFGLSYSTQEYQGGHPSALAAVTDGSRNVGELYAFDRWRIHRAITLEYGGRYAHYDYLERQGLLSPRFGFVLNAFDGARVRVTAGQRMVAPGAEEFLASKTPGPWLPPERTFAPLGAVGDADPFRVERVRSYDITFEREIGSRHVVGVGRFHQSIDDQLVTIFGLGVPGGPTSVGHYYVGSVGPVEADGWAFRLNTSPTARIQGSVQYSLTRARWNAAPGPGRVAAVAPAAIRIGDEDLHDLTSSVSADIVETATRVFVLYRVNSSFVQRGAGDRWGLDGRFDVQVNQAIPVGIAGTRWEVLVGLRNLFRDPLDVASVYDELLVVRPPKRFVGGLLVRF